MSLGSTGYGPSTRLLFDGDERKYEMWEDKLLAYMKIHKLKDAILPESTAIVSQDKREEAYAQLVQFLDERSHSLVMRDGKDDGRKALAILRDHYRGSGKQRIISLYTTLTTLQKQINEDLTSYIIRAENAATALKSAGSIVEDALLIAMILKGLPENYKPFNVYVTQQEKAWTFLSFKTAIRNYEENERASVSTAKNSNAVMYAHGQRGNGGRRNDNENISSPSSGRSNNDSRGMKGIVCFGCGTEGHKSNACPSRSQQNRHNNTNNKAKWCKLCKSTSHTDSTCRKQKRDEQKDFAKHVQDESSSLQSNFHSFVLGAFDDEVSPNKSILVDSGASTHIVTDTSKFVSFQLNFQPEEHTIELADGSVESFAEKKGTILVHFRDGNGNIRDIYLENTMYCPTFPQEIFSVKSVCKKNAKVILCNDESELILEDGTTFPISTHGGLFYIDLVERCQDKDVVNSVTKSTARHTLEEWHKILGHVNRKDIVKLETVVDDMKILSKKDFPCDTCILSKQVVPQSREPDERATAPLEFVHTDIAGPIEPMAKDGFRYAINFVDDYSGTCFVYFLKQKSDAVKALKKFICDVAPYGKIKHLCRIRSDNGGEFISHDFEDVLIENQIRHEFSKPYSPHQNGTAERNWRTLFEMARSMLIDSNLPRFLWAYAIMAAAHIRNRMYCQRISDTPYRLLTGKKPSISKLHVFGSICFANVHQKTKLDPRSRKGKFVGYDKYSPSYLVYFPDSKSVMKNGTVKFTERFDSNPRAPVINENYSDQSNTVLRNDKCVETFDNFSTTDTRDVNFYTPRDFDTLFSTPYDTYLNFNSRITDNIDDDTTPLRDNTEHLEAVQNITVEENDDVLPLMNPNRAEHQPAVTVAHKEESGSRYPRRKELTYVKDYTKSAVDVCYKVSTMPTSYNQAIRSKDADEWHTSMEAEMTALKDNNVFSVVPLPKDKKVVGSRWVYSVKDKPNGNTLHKARFVAKGFSQIKGSDYTDTYSPTVKMTTVRMMMQLAAEHKMSVHQLDVKTAYLNAPIDCEVYIRQPEGFVETKENTVLVWKLHKSLYGLKQSGRNWNVVLTDFFRSNDFQQSEVDPCLFVKRDKTDMTYVAIWVDDIVITANSEELINNIKETLKKKFKMTDLGPISWFLGIEFEQTDDGISMCQSYYLKGVLERFEMMNCKPRTTPCEAKLNEYDCPAENTPSDVTRYRGIVGSLIYAMICTRPDLAFVVTKLSQNLANPTKGDWITVDHVLRYIKGSLDNELSHELN